MTTMSIRPAETSTSAQAAAERWILFASILASSMAFIDGSALNVALPSLQADLQASGAQLLWIVNAYLLTKVNSTAAPLRHQEAISVLCPHTRRYQHNVVHFQCRV